MSLKKNNLAVGLALLITFTVGIIIGSYIPKIETALKNRKLSVQKEQIEEQLKKDRILNENDFSIGMPAGWAGISPMPATSATVAFIKEDVTDPTLKKINFRSYYAITYDTLNKKTLLGYTVYLKNTLAKLLPGIRVTKESNEKINGRDAHFIEAAVTQRGTNFNVLIATIKGDNDDVWTISFNVGSVNWEAYKETLYNVSRTFTLKTPEATAAPASQATQSTPTTSATPAPNAQK